MSRFWDWINTIQALPKEPEPGYDKQALLAVAFAMLPGTKGGNRIYLSDGEIAQRSGVSRPTVIKYRTWMEDHGYLRFTGESKGHQGKPIKVKRIWLPGWDEVEEAKPEPREQVPTVEEPRHWYDEEDESPFVCETCESGEQCPWHQT